jgi:hypothetical protein
MAKNRFEDLASVFKGDDLPPESQIEQDSLPEPSASVAPDDPKPRKRTGKRSREGYTQTGAYIPEDLYNDVKRKLIGQPYDYSDLIAQLLKEWLAKD